MNLSHFKWAPIISNFENSDSLQLQFILLELFGTIVNPTTEAILGHVKVLIFAAIIFWDPSIFSHFFIWGFKVSFLDTPMHMFVSDKFSVKPVKINVVRKFQFLPYRP